ncbi:hypothetical protein HYFRA_00005652 [Hymenoscyphus fraxineus]|uniref:Myb-like domain-containing protein n=1 Tax=Hymenoscyphus fraxineus TaxID=746836 RepID=A0A9N9PQV3_9HELO|nr:hypothetical protein HYFRA_00005652 [Hymenoscyphus fraxineus]
MYATIEPRLIARFNNDETAQRFDDSPSTSLELPPLQDPNILKANGRPLLLEPDASTLNGNGKPASSSASSAQRNSSLTNLIDDGENAHGEGGQGSQKTERRTTDRALGISSPQSLRKILGEDVSVSTGVISKKRSLGDNKDDFVQLPQPPKKQKAVQQVPPIIIGLFQPPPQAALFPPIASSSFHDRHGRNTLNTTNDPPNVKEVEEAPKNVPLQDLEEKIEGGQENKGKKVVRTRKKWTEEETSALLLGVNRHGIGCWTDILEDPSFSFNNRSAADLKDRFRTCCPAELRGDKPLSKFQGDKGKGSAPVKSKTGLLSENILINEEDLESSVPSGDNSKSKKSRTHRKKVEDLVQLGIEGPFRKSHRRERTKFSEEDDREILQGYQIHGPAWSRIQRDPQFHLQNRKPTDLRDRFRNKYPEKFKSEEKGDPGKISGKKSSLGAEIGTTVDGHASLPLSDRKGKDISDPKSSSVGVSQVQQPSFLSSKMVPELRDLESLVGNYGPKTQPSSSNPSSNREGLRIEEILSSDRDGSKSLSFQPQTSLFGFKDNFTPFVEAPITETTETNDNLPFTQSFDWGGSMAAPFPGSMGEMDISRILLDEDWINNSSLSNTKEKSSVTDLNHIISSQGDPPSSSSYFNLICDPEEQIVDLQDSTFA